MINFFQLYSVFVELAVGLTFLVTKKSCKLFFHVLFLLKLEMMHMGVYYIVWIICEIMSMIF